MRSSKPVLLAAVAIFVVSACGGAAPAPTPAPTGTPAVGVTPSPVTSTIAPTAAPSQAPVATPPPVGGVMDICGLLTVAELNAATGEQYAAGTRDPVGECFWNLEGATSNTGSLIVGNIQPGDLATIVAAFGAGGTETTVGGHPAFWNPGEGLNSLWVDIGGGRLFVLSFPRSGDLDPSYKVLAESLAAIALGRL